MTEVPVSSTSRAAFPLRLAFALASAFAFATACADGSPTDPARPMPLPPLESALWYAHAAEGQELPALVAHGQEGSDLVQDFLDSARVQVNAAGSWERVLWISRYRAGAFEANVANQEVGRWTATDSGYLFRADVSGRTFVLPRMQPGDSVVVPLRSVGDGGYLAATLRTAPAPVSVVGVYHAAQVGGRPLPAAIYVFPDYEEDGRVMDIHLIIDTVRLQLHGNGAYTQRIKYTEWEGPPGGAPATIRFEYVVQDFGMWSKVGPTLQFASGWIQPLRFGGTVTDGSTLELRHGISHGDEPVPFRYTR